MRKCTAVPHKVIVHRAIATKIQPWSTLIQLWRRAVLSCSEAETDEHLGFDGSWQRGLLLKGGAAELMDCV